MHATFYNIVMLTCFALLHYDIIKSKGTPKVTEALPVVRDYDCRFYLKPEVGGLMVGEFESPHKDMPSHVAARNLSPVRTLAPVLNHPNSTLPAFLFCG